MPKPHRISIAFEGFFPTTPSYDSNFDPIITDGTFTELVTYDNNLVLTHEVALQYSRAVNRYILSGDFVLIGSQYDDIQTAKAAGFNQLIVKYEQYSEVGAAYVEVYRGFVDLDGESDENAKTVKLSQFEVVDKYSDFINGWEIDKVSKNNLVYTGANGTTTQGYLLQGVDAISLLLFNAQYSREYIATGQNMVNYTTSGVGAVPTFTLIFGAAGAANTGQELYWGEMQRAKDITGATLAKGLSYTVKNVMDLYSDLFDLEWDIIEEWQYPPTAIPIKNTLVVIKTISLYNKQPSGAPDYSAESADFAKYSFIKPKNNRIESWIQSKSNVDTDHIDGAYEYDVNSEINKKTSYSNYFTDFDYFNTGDLTLLDNDQVVVCIANANGAGSESVDTATGITHGGTVANYIISLANRLENWTNNYRQLDEALFNGSIQALNSAIAEPMTEQEPFYVNEDLITDIDIFRYVLTSLGLSQVKSVSQGFYDTHQRLICTQ